MTTVQAHPYVGRNVLVLEDDYFLADTLQEALTEEGMHVLGPYATVRDAAPSLGEDVVVDLAMLDVNLGGDVVYPLADLLLERKVPMIFTTGYDMAALPQRFRHVPLCAKPYSLETLLESLAQILR